MLTNKLGAMKQSALLEFESTSFAIEPGEDELTNPGVFGKALATWLAEQLRTAGSLTGEVNAEDFGWCIPVGNVPFVVERCRMTAPHS